MDVEEKPTLGKKWEEELKAAGVRWREESRRPRWRKGSGGWLSRRPCGMRGEDE
ncbi:unnamed protein product [Rhodiola kirilowii]